MTTNLGGASNSGFLPDTLIGGKSPIFYNLPIYQQHGKLWVATEQLFNTNLVAQAIAGATNFTVVAAGATQSFRVFGFIIVTDIATTLEWRNGATPFCRFITQAGVALSFNFPPQGFMFPIVNTALNLFNIGAGAIVVNGTVYYHRPSSP